jgi:hypothetical protein
MGTLRRILTHRHLPVALAILAMALTAPSLWQGWLADDLLHRKMLLTSTLPELLKGLFVFVDPDKNLQLMDLDTDLGTMPWWTLDTLRIAFFRPLSALTHWLDYQLWPDSGVLMHAQSILWYGGACALAVLVYRRLMGATWVAGLAGFLFAVDTVHLGSVAWLANRNGLLALLFGLLALMAHDRWRRAGWRAGALLAPFWLALALLSAEAGVSTGAYLLAYAIFLDRGTWYQRLGCLMPYAAVVAVWRLVCQRLGFGAWGSGFYTDPVREPMRFAAATLERGPVLLLSQWLGQVPLAYNTLSVAAARVVWISALVFLSLVGIALAPLIRRDRVARFWCLGMVIAVIPTCAINVLSGRLLLFVGLGAMGLTAQFIASLVERAGWLPVHRAWRSLARILCFLLVGLHAVLPIILLPVMVRVPDALQAVITQVTDIGPLPEPSTQDVVIVNAPSPFHFIYLPGLRFVRNQPIPSHIRVLAPGYFSVAVARLDAHTLLIQPQQGYLLPPGALRGENQAALPLLHVVYMYQHLSKFFRSDAFPISLGEQIELTGMSVEVVSLTSDRRPLEAQVRFNLPLEDSSMRWMQWDWEKGGYVPFVPPAVGSTVHISGPF